MPIFCQFGDAVIERAQFAEQSLKLLLDRKAPSLLFWV